jgi:glycosyltransferase involved in cell wall biosynthesis
MDVMDLWAFARAEVTICSARAYRHALFEGGLASRRLRLLPWGVPAGKGGKRPGSTRATTPIIGTLGRIERRKGQLDLVRAFARLRSRRPDVRLEIVGPVADQAYGAEITATVERLKLEGAVRLTGHVVDPQRHVEQWSVYVSLSEDEGQGLAVLEAMASGVPVVALRAAGVEDYLTNERTGLTARSRSAPHIAGLINRLLTDRQLAARLTRSALRMVHRRYSWGRTVERIEAIYGELIDRSRHGRASAHATPHRATSSD